jgi:spore coat protein A
MKLTRRQFAKLTAMAGGAMMIPWRFKLGRAQIPGGTLDPASVSKFAWPLVKPPAFAPEKGSNKNKVRYDVAVRQFQQQIAYGAPATTVWSYGPGRSKRTDLASGYFYPAFTIENTWNKTTQVLWRNELVDAMGNPLPHLLPVDPTLHWANPIGLRDRRPNPADAAYWNHPYLNGPNGEYTGPVPMVTHVHGAHTTEESDGYAEAWYLPASAAMDPNIVSATGTFFDYFNNKYQAGWTPGSVSFKYPNDQPATTLWYHDHTLGMTRLNVYAGPAGYWLIRGGPNDANLGYVAPGVGDNPLGNGYSEIPIVIQDRSFNADGSLFYPDNRAFFEGLTPAQLQIPFTPDFGCNGQYSDVAPIWQPEFFGNMMVVNGRTWPYLEVEQTKYRFRFLNGCNSRFLILKTSNNMPFYQLGGDQGFLPAPEELNQLLMAPAERADVVMDFSNIPVGTEVTLLNFGPDEPFGGGTPGVDFDAADPGSTGLVMQFRVVGTNNVPTTGTIPTSLPAKAALPASTVARQVSLNEEESKTVFVSEDASGNTVLDCNSTEPFGPTAALLGTLAGGAGVPLPWMDPITELPALGATETWEIHNFTMDAHPIHVHLVHFEVVNREDASGNVRLPEAWEQGPMKDTVIAYPDEITRIKATFDLPGYYVWHCHIVEHEDNEMMRPYFIGGTPNGPQP